MGIRLGNRVFAPGFLMTFISVLSFALFSMLGSWQLERANLKRDIENRFVEQLQQPYKSIILGSTVNDLLVYRKVKLTGGYRDDRILLLDNMVNQGVAGYQVLVPFVVQGGAKAVLVNRGWVAADADRSKLPDIRKTRVANHVLGVITVPASEGYRLGKVELTANWPQRIPFVDIEKIQQGMSLELLPYVIWQAPEMDDYYIRDWKPVWSSPEKSEAYALQWFSFALIVLILYVVLNLKKGVLNE